VVRPLEWQSPDTSQQAQRPAEHNTCGTACSGTLGRLGGFVHGQFPVAHIFRQEDGNIAGVKACIHQRVGGLFGAIV
jgi:hypothetical protein